MAGCWIGWFNGAKIFCWIWLIVKELRNVSKILLYSLWVCADCLPQDEITIGHDGQRIFSACVNNLSSYGDIEFAAQRHRTGFASAIRGLRMPDGD